MCLIRGNANRGNHAAEAAKMQAFPATFSYTLVKNTSSLKAGKVYRYSILCEKGRNA